MRVILDLCGGTGSWSQPYRDAGYTVIVIDPNATAPGSIRTDVRLWRPVGLRAHGVLAAPPCTIFAGSGARWWASKGDAALIEGLSIVDACLRIIALVKPQWWALENPVGRLRHYIGPPRVAFDPWQYGDPYSKRTLLWGRFTMPPPTVSHRPLLDDRIHRASPGPGRAAFRSITPSGFARAFADVNP